MKALLKTVLKIIRNRRNRHDNYGDLHHATEILAGYHLDPVEDEYERLADWLQGNRQSADRHRASEREYQMWVFLERRGWSRAALQRLSDDATQGG